MHTFEYGRFKGRFSKTTSVKRRCGLLLQGNIFQDERGRKTAQTYGNGDDVL